MPLFMATALPLPRYATAVDPMDFASAMSGSVAACMKFPGRQNWLNIMTESCAEVSRVGVTFSMAQMVLLICNAQNISDA